MKSQESNDMRGRSDEQIENRQEAAVADERAPAPTPTMRTPDNTARPQDRADVRRDAEPRVALFEEGKAVEFRRRWSEVQTGFVDEPRAAVQRADSLVGDVMKQLSDAFAGARATLEQQWDRGDNVTTEDLRLALQRYRSFFDRLLSM
jgi:hypothetical protein